MKDKKKLAQEILGDSEPEEMESEVSENDDMSKAERVAIVKNLVKAFESKDASKIDSLLYDYISLCE